MCSRLDSMKEEEKKDEGENENMNQAGESMG